MKRVADSGFVKMGKPIQEGKNLFLAFFFWNVFKILPTG